MKATDLLQQQHRELEALLEKLRTAGQGEERNVRQELAAKLVAHTVIEEEHFYPAIHEALPEETLEALEEHGLADVQLARLLASRMGEETFDAKLAVLSEVLIRHIRREETDILRTADRELGDEVLDQLGDKMLLRFRQIVDTGYAKILQKALEAELPRTPSRVMAAKKTARRAPARAAAKKKAAPKARAVPRRAPTKRAGTKRRAAAAPRKSPKQTRSTRAAGKTRTHA